jgi:hypothetical protein
MYLGDLCSHLSEASLLGMVIGAVAFIVLYVMVMASPDYSPSDETLKDRLKMANIALIIFLICVSVATILPGKETIRVAQVEYIATSTPVSKVVYRVAKWLDAAILPNYAEKENKQ